MRVAPITLLSAANIASDQTSTVQALTQIFSYSIQCNFSGASPAGTLSLQVSNDNVNFADIPASVVTISDTGTTMYNVSGSNYQYVRAKWAHTGGSAGALTVLCYIRGF